MSLPCPRCGKESLLVEQRVMLVPDEPERPLMALWGRPSSLPDSPVFCNMYGCHWRGTVSEARELAPKHPLI